MIKKIRKIKINKKWGVFSIFVFFSLVLWFLNALNQEYTTDISVPVDYYNIPKGKANTSELPNDLLIAVKAYGYNILKYELKKNFVPFKVDLSSSSFIQLYANDTSWYYTLTKEYIEQIDNQFQGNMKIEFIKPDTLYFHFTNLIQKKVPIVANAKVLPADQYILKGKVKFKPDSVLLKGPASILDTLKNIKSQYFELLNISSSIREDVNLENINGVKIIPSKVKLIANIEEYTEMSFRVNITSLNVPDSVYLHLFPSYVTVICKVGISNYNNVSADDFEVDVDYNSILENMGSKLATKVIAKTNKIYSYYQTPEFVEYVIEKR